MNNINNLVSKLINEFDTNDKKKYLFKKLSDDIIKDVINGDIVLNYAKRILRISYDYLIYCNNFKQTLPSQNSLNGYLWLHYKDKYYLSRLINHINLIYKNSIHISKIKKPIFSRPKRSHQILKERVIYILNNLEDKHLTHKYIVDTFIGYFHWIYIPSNVYISLNNFRCIKGFYYCIILEYKFYFPKVLFDNLK